MDVLVQHGATPEIRVNAHPHIGTNKLPKIIQAIRETISRHGGEVLFNSRVTDILIKYKKVRIKAIIRAIKCGYALIIRF